jgi:hypothetical protein
MTRCYVPEGWKFERRQHEHTDGVRTHSYLVTMPDGFTTVANSRDRNNTQSRVLYKLIAAMRTAESEA